MNKYIFLTDEGYTYQSNSTSAEPDCENSQVLGIIEADNAEKAYEKLVEVMESNFKEIYCYQLDDKVRCKYFKR